MPGGPSGASLTGRGYANDRLLISLSATHREGAQEAALLEHSSGHWANASAWLAAIVEGTEDAIVGKDTGGLIRSWNPGAERLFGFRADEIIGLPISTLAPPERVDELPGILARIARGERVQHYQTVRRRKDGSLVPVSLTVSPVRNRSGMVIGASKIARDVTQERLAREKQALLIAELNHRVKNTLATVQSIARQTLRASEGLEQFGALFEARLLALSRAHSILSAGSWGHVALSELMRVMLEPFRGEGENRFRLDGDEVVVSPNIFLMLALAIQELATNAVKYGALSSPTGRVHVTWHSSPSGGGGEVTLQWREQDGPQILTPPHRRGFGARLLDRIVAYDLGGVSDLSFTREGVQWQVRFPLTDKAT